jgi:hypothetical protein
LIGFGAAAALEADLPFAAFVFAMDYPIVYWFVEKCLSASRNVGEICGLAN